MATYVAQNDLFKVPLYLILLNGGDFSSIERVIDALDAKGCFLAETRAAFNVAQEEDEIANTLQPIVYTSFNGYDGGDVVYVYTKQQDASEGDRLLINDISVLAKKVIITEDMVVSPNLAKPFSDCEITEYGFRYFYDYCLDSSCAIGKWLFEYKPDNKAFTMSFTFDGDNVMEIYRKKMDKNESYKHLIYAIKKLCSNPKESGLTFNEDNYDVNVRTKKS